jgi:hypothetical protein
MQMTLRDSKELLQRNGYQVVSLPGCAWVVHYQLCGEYKQTFCRTASDLINFAKGVDAA